MDLWSDVAVLGTKLQYAALTSSMFVGISCSLWPPWAARLKLRLHCVVRLWKRNSLPWKMSGKPVQAIPGKRAKIVDSIDVVLQVKASLLIDKHSGSNELRRRLLKESIGITASNTNFVTTHIKSYLTFTHATHRRGVLLACDRTLTPALLVHKKSRQLSLFSKPDQLNKHHFKGTHRMLRHLGSEL